MKLKNYLHRAISIPPHKLASKVTYRTGRKIRFLLQRQNDFRSSTYTQPILSLPGELRRYLQVLPANLLHSQGEIISALSKLYFAHQFNLLGSGWVQVRHGMACHGLDGHRYEAGPPVQADKEGLWLKSRVSHSNLSESQRIWSLVDHDYTPIDWHLDFKSGYRWSEDIWYLDILHGHEPGVDIKVPWEMARMQHLPLLAWACALARDGQKGFAPPEIYAREFRNEILDFIATNPPRFGVNWKSTMDVGIRATNWLVAYDIFRAYGAEFDGPFKKELFCSIYQHGVHILKHLEWNEKNRGNHYLSNIASLLFIAAYLPCTPEIDSWLAFGVQELISEVEYQFTPDGANFEASTSYHRLSTEMALYATALVMGLGEEKKVALKKYDCQLLKVYPKLRPAPMEFHTLVGSNRVSPFPQWYIARLERMAEFTTHIIKPNSHIPQIGDNDSGRFLKLAPIFESQPDLSSRDENDLDHRHLVAAMNGLFNRGDFTLVTGKGWLETEVVRSLAGNTHLLSYSAKKRRSNEHNGSEVHAYPGFGLYIYRRKNMYLAVRCGSIGQNGNGGHAHNDNLSFELNIKGEDFIVDGGSYLYTPLPKVRNDFRSTRAHNTLSIQGLEQNRWKKGLKGLFSMKNDVRPHIIKYNEECFEGEYLSNGIKHARSFKLGASNIIIEDCVRGNLFGELGLNFAPRVEIIQISKDGVDEFTLKVKISDVYPRVILDGFSEVETTEGFFSKGYGVRLRNQLIRCHRARSVTEVTIEIGPGDI